MSKILHQPFQPLDITRTCDHQGISVLILKMQVELICKIVVNEQVFWNTLLIEWNALIAVMDPP